MTNKKLIKSAIAKVRDDMHFLDDTSYKLNGEDSYTPVYLEMQDIVNCFGIDPLLDGGGMYEDTEEVLADLQDIIDSNTDVILYTPSKQDITRAKHEYQHIDDNFSDVEMLDVYHYKIPQPLDKRDIRSIFKVFVNAMKHADVVPQTKASYEMDIAPLAITEWMD